MAARIYAAIAALAIAGFFAGIALSQAPTEPNARADINGDGHFNPGDQGILAEQIVSGRTVGANPCVESRLINDANPYQTPADGALVINTEGEIVTPSRGRSLVIEPDHPAYGVLLSGSPWPLVACQ